jgi:hypothetical protein
LGSAGDDRERLDNLLRIATVASGDEVLDKIVFNYAASRRFERGDFVEVKEPRPHVRLGPKLAREIAALALREIPFRNCTEAVQRIAKLL